MDSNYFILIGLLTCLTGGSAVAGHAGPIRLEELLPKNEFYDNMVPPKIDGKPTTVNFHVTVINIDSIDHSSMTYAADVFLAQTWKDERLQFPSNMTAEYRPLPVAWLDDMWRPDSFFRNAKTITLQDLSIPNHYIWQYSDSTILYIMKLSLLLSCPMNFRYYPHDTQHCKMQIESLAHTTDDLVFEWDPAIPLEVNEIELPQFTLAHTSTGDCTQVYSTGNFTCLELVFTFKRRLTHFLFHIYVPTCLIVIVSWISFWIQPEAIPARLTFGLISLLALLIQHLCSQEILPPATYLKAIDVFMSSCTLFVFLSLMESALVNVVIGNSNEHDEQSLLAKALRFISGKLGRPSNTGKRENGYDAHEQETPGDSDGKRATYITQTSASNSARTQLMELPLPSRPENEAWSIKNKALRIDQFSRIFFPLAFFLFNLWYWVVFESSP